MTLCGESLIHGRQNQRQLFDPRDNDALGDGTNQSHVVGTFLIGGDYKGMDFVLSGFLKGFFAVGNGIAQISVFKIVGPPIGQDHQELYQGLHSIKFVNSVTNHCAKASQLLRFQAAQSKEGRKLDEMTPKLGQEWVRGILNK